MRFLTARRLALLALVPASLAFGLIPGCSNQGEGERCGGSVSDPTGAGPIDNDDCSSGLVCVAIGSVNRCCNSNQAIVNDSRCVRSGGTASGGSSGVDAGDSGTDTGAAGSGTDTGAAGSATDTGAAGSGPDAANPNAGAGGI